MKSNIFIPTKIKVGFNKRDDTFTKKLGFVIYWKDNEWKQEKSWEGWREKYADETKQLEIIEEYNNSYYVTDPRYSKTYPRASTFEDVPQHFRRGLSNDIGINPLEFENVPLEGYVLNKKVGGGNSSGWNHRNTYCRVYDPRGFEFEISIENLLYILDNTNSIVGKGLEGKFVLGWVDKKVVLIPEKSPEFEDMINFTNNQSNKIGVKDLVNGLIYIKKDSSRMVYLGKFNEYERYYNYKDKGKKYFWKDLDAKYGDGIQTTTSLSGFSHKESDELYFDYANVMDELEHKPIYSPYDESKFLYEKDEKGEYLKIGNNYFNCANKYSLNEKEENANQSLERRIKYYNNNQFRSYWTPQIEPQKITFYGNHSDVIIPYDMNRWEYINNVLGGFYSQIKYLKNGKKAK